MHLPVVTLGTEHRASAINTLASAFQDDPALGWIQHDNAKRSRALPTLFRWLFDAHLGAGRILGTAHAEAVTLWFTPGRIHSPPALRLQDAVRLLGAFGPRVARAALVSYCIERHFPPGENWWYLRYAAVRPDQQGKGLGGALIRAGIAEAAAQRLPVFLETCKPGNVAIYRSLGFRIHSEWDVPFGGPHFWTMARPLS